MQAALSTVALDAVVAHASSYESPEAYEADWARADAVLTVAVLSIFLTGRWVGFMHMCRAVMPRTSGVGSSEY